MRKKTFALISLGFIIIVTWSFLITNAETEVPLWSVGDQWSYGWFNGEFTGEVGGHKMTVTVDRMENFEGIPCYVCIHKYQHDEHENRTFTVWMTSDWVVLKEEDYLSYTVPDAETNITFIYNPGMKLYDFPLTVGKEWSGRSYRTIEQTWYDAEGEDAGKAVDYIDWFGKVVSTETISVPSGTFETYVVELSDYMPERRLFFSIDAKNLVKWEFPGESGGGDVLTSYELAPQDDDDSNLYLPIALGASIGVLCFTSLLYYRRNRYKWGTLSKVCIPTRHNSIMKRESSLQKCELIV